MSPELSATTTIETAAPASRFTDPRVPGAVDAAPKPNVRCLDDAEQPQDKNKDQKTAETDIHHNLRLFVLPMKRGAAACRSTCYGPVRSSLGYYFTRREHAGFA